jgi:glycosyltransferase involved in cell wall biosynthesis
MKIVVLGTRGFPNVQGGVEKHCEKLYPCLVKLGAQVTVLTRKPYIDPEVKSYLGVSLIPISCPKQKFLEAIVHTFKGVWAAKRLKPDILHVHAVGPSLMITLARLLGLKVVMTHHGPDYERKKWNVIAKTVLKLGEWAGCRFANQVIVISQTIAKQVKTKYNRETIIIPNGVNIPQISNTDEALRKFGLEKGKYILAVGRFVPEKGFHDLIEAYSKCKSPYKLVIVGDADHEDEYSRKLKDQAGDVSNIVLTGFLTGQELFELYSHAGLFILPSYYEGLPIVLLEAMSYGLSCVVSDIPANREVPLSQERYFKPGDIDQMGQRIQEFVLKPFMEEDRKKQVELIKQSYNWDKIAVQTQQVYSTIC